MVTHGRFDGDKAAWCGRLRVDQHSASPGKVTCQGCINAWTHYKGDLSKIKRNMPPKPPRGRPATTGRYQRSARKLTIPLSVEERAEVTTLAKSRGKTPHAWARDTLLAIVRASKLPR